MFRLFSRHSKYSHPFKRIQQSISSTNIPTLYSVVFNLFEQIQNKYTVVFNVFEQVKNTYGVVFNLYEEVVIKYSVVFNLIGEILPQDIKYEVVFSNIYEELDPTYTVVFILSASDSTTTQDCIPFPCINQ